MLEEGDGVGKLQVWSDAFEYVLGSIFTIFFNYY